MSIGNRYNNNDDYKPTSTVYTPFSFSNPNSSICKSRLTAEYFNKLLKINIALQSNENSGDSYAKYDNNNQVSVYVSYTKAKMLYDLIQQMKSDSKIFNVCIELKGGLLTVSNGSEYGTSSPCISISVGDESGNIRTVIYETKTNYHKGAKNYKDSKYDDVTFDNLELEAFENLLIQYYNASSYAVAATVMEASMYKHNGIKDTLHAIASKVGAVESKNSGNYNSKSFLSNNNSNSNYSSSMDNIPTEYEQSSFEDIANALSGNK